MATFSELQERVLSRVIDAPDFIQTEVPFLINEAIRSLQRRHNFKVMEAQSGPNVTTLGSQTLVTITNWKEARGLPFRIENLGGVREMTYTPNRAQASRLFSLDPDIDIGEPSLLLETETVDEDDSRTFQVFPFPDGFSDYEDGEYRIYIPYWKYLPNLSANDDSNWFTNNAVEYILAAATSRGFELSWDEARAQVWEDKAIMWANEVIMEDKKKRISMANTMPYYTGARSIRIGA